MPESAAEFHCVMDCEGFPCFVAKNYPQDEPNDSSNLEETQHCDEAEKILNMSTNKEKSPNMSTNKEEGDYFSLTDHSLGHFQDCQNAEKSPNVSLNKKKSDSFSLTDHSLRHFQDPASENIFGSNSNHECQFHEPVIFCHASSKTPSCPVYGMTDNQRTKINTFKDVITPSDDELLNNGRKIKITHLPDSKISFKIPKKFLPKREESNKKESNVNNEETLNFHPMKINIWEEFYYGPSILNKESQRTPRFPCFFSNLGTLVSKQFLDKIVFSTYIFLFFITCIIFNHVGKLACYCVMKNHLSIHEMAYTKRLKIQFSENLFQGPYNVYLRFLWCAHCCQSVNEKVVLKLMKEYRDEITGLS